MSEEQDNPFVQDLLRSVGPRFCDSTFATYDVPPGDKNALATMMAWAKDFTPGSRGIFMVGPTGTGKTHLAVSALLGLSARYVLCRYVDVPVRIERMRSRIGSGQEPGARAGFRDAMVVLLDELGEVKPTEWVVEQVYLMVDMLYKSNVTTIVTSNKDYDELVGDLGERTVSRLIQMTQKVPVPGDDYRMLQARGDV